MTTADKGEEDDELMITTSIVSKPQDNSAGTYYNSSFTEEKNKGSEVANIFS